MSRMSEAQLILLEYAEPLVALVESAEVVSRTASENRDDGTISIGHDAFRRLQDASEASVGLLDLIPRTVTE